MSEIAALSSNGFLRGSACCASERGRSVNLPEIPVEDFPYPVLLTNDIVTFICMLHHRSRGILLARMDRDRDSNRSIRKWRDLVERNVIVPGMGVACSEPIIWRRWMLWIDGPQLIGRLIVLLVDIAII